MAVAASAVAWRQREIVKSGSKAAPRHGGGAAAARRNYQWRQRRRWGRMTKAAAVMVCGGEKKLFCIFSILIVGEEAICPDGLFDPAVFRESDFYLNSLIFEVLVRGHCRKSPPPDTQIRRGIDPKIQ